LGATSRTTWAAFDLTSLAPPASDCPASTTQLHFSNRPHQGLDPADSGGRKEIEAGSFVFEFGHICRIGRSHSIKNQDGASALRNMALAALGTAASVHT
jgi:hypothetical protein